MYFSFGEQFQTGELALNPADEADLEIALALQQLPGPLPPFATVPVLLSGRQIGALLKICFVNGDTCYQFVSESGNTNICASTPDAVLQRLSEVLGFTSPPQDAP